jgi:hypothetical protein
VLVEKSVSSDEPAPSGGRVAKDVFIPKGSELCSGVVALPDAFGNFSTGLQATQNI